MNDFEKGFRKDQQDRQYKAFMRTKEDKVALVLAYGVFIVFWFAVLALAIGG